MPSKAFLGLTSLASVAVALGLAGVAIGQGAPAAHKPAPGPVSHDEAMKRAHDMFARLDANHDGKITAEEVAQAKAHMRQMMRDKIFDALDTNHDGNISKAEWAAAADRRAQRMTERREHGPMGGHGMGSEGGHGGMGHGGMGRHMRGHMGGGRGAAGFLARFDADGDGAVSEQEFMAKAEARFQRMDRNHDGVITPDERHMGGRGDHGMRHGQHHGGADDHGDADKK